ncbi:hypothetical protein ACLOJK_016878 [Asimina triloba]
MPNVCIDPSSLHLKKELTVLRKSRCFRDPETSSSWRSPVSSRSVVGSFNWNCGDGAKGDSNGFNASVSLEPTCAPPLRSENDEQKVFLHNWRHQSAMPNDIAVALDGEKNMQRFIQGSLEDSLGDGDSRSNACLDGPITVLRAKINTTSETTRRRVTRKFKRSNKPPKHFLVRGSPSSEQLDLPSGSLRSLSIGQSDGTEYSNSEDLQFSDNKFPWRIANTSLRALQLLSRYENKPHLSENIKSSREEDSSYSYTPASTSSCKRYRARYASTVGSWDGSTASPDEDEMGQLDLPRYKGCGIPCYWTGRTKRGGRGSCSPSLSETLRRTGSSILCGSRTRHYKRRTATSSKRKSVSKSVHSLPLLSNSCDGGWSSIDSASAEFISDLGELHLEASSRLDGRRSSCMSPEGSEPSLMVRDDREPENRSLSLKYKPRSFDELVGHDTVVQSLGNAIKRRRIAPVYLFQGPHGTGKTSMARLFAAALNCLSSEEKKPCWSCSRCTDFTSGKSADVLEADATNTRGMNKVRLVLKNLSESHSFMQYKVFIIRGCHMLPSKALTTLLQFLEGQPSRVVFIFITSDPDYLPRALASRCRKYLFHNIKDSDIVARLRKLSAEENIEVESDALDQIALNSDGSLRDAEMMLDQLSLMGKRITTSLVNDFVGIVLDEKLLDLLALAMSSDTAETVKRARELMGSAVDPVTLMSQLAGLIRDIIGGTYRSGDAKPDGASLSLRSLTESEVKRLKQALKILSEAGKQLRISSECSTWFTAALLQLSSGHYSDSEDKQTHKKIKENVTTSATRRPRKSTSSPIVETVDRHHGDPSSSLSVTEGSELDASCRSFMDRKRAIGCVSYDKLEEIWRMCIEKCHSNTLRQLLVTYGKLVSISDAKGFLIAYIAFTNEGIKSRAERFLSSITNSIETVLRRDVEVRMGLMGDSKDSPTGLKAVESRGSTLVTQRQTEVAGEIEKGRNSDHNRLSVSSYKSSCKEPKPPRKSFNGCEDMVQRIPDSCSSCVVPDRICQMSGLPILSAEGNIYSRREQMHQSPLHATIEDLRLESAWLQAVEKGTPGSASRLRPERNQVLPQDGAFCEREVATAIGLAVSTKSWNDEQNHEIKPLEMTHKQRNLKDQSISQIGHYPMSPSLLHSNSNSLRTIFNRENL